MDTRESVGQQCRYARRARHPADQPQAVEPGMWQGADGAGRAGRLPKLSPEQLAQVVSALIQGAEANRYPNELWTLQRAAQVIQRVTGVSYHPARVWYILRHGLDWTWQRPARRATERNDEAIQRWVKKRWPRTRKSAISSRSTKDR